MADIFISYAAEDRETAHSLAAALERHSLSVWWDRKIPAGDSFDDAIEREIERASSVVVLWSIHSTRSEWVKSEAAAAVDSGKLIPIAIDRAKLPLEFRRRQTLSLVGWEGTPTSELLHPLFDAISAKKGHSISNGFGTSPSTNRIRRKYFRTAIVIAVVLIAVFGGIIYRDRSMTPAPNAASQQSSAILGTWRHYSGVFWTIYKTSGANFSVRQTDPEKGLTMRGTARQVGDVFELTYEVLPEPVMKGTGRFSVSQDGSEISLKYKHESGETGSLVFRR